MRRVFIGFIVFIFIFCSGCIEKKASVTVTNTKTQNYLVYGLEDFPDDLIQLNTGSNQDKDMLLSLFEGLVKIDENGKIAPGLAESFSEGKDNITYTFKLREDARWSDGKPIVANDFVLFFKNILDPKINNSYANQLYYIFGAEDYNKGKKPFNGVAIRAIDDKTLEIRLNSPSKCLLQILSQPIYTLREIDNNLRNWKTEYNSINFTGPFKLEGLDKNGEITLIKNDFYYDKEEVKLEKLYLTCIAGNENAMANFKTGKINLFLNPPLSENKNLIINGEEEIIPISTGSSLNFNFKKPSIVNDVNFRRALSLGIDREQIAGEELDNLARAAFSYVPSEDSTNTQALKDKEFLKETSDISQSKKFLNDSHYDKREKIKFVYLNNSQNNKLVDGLVKSFKDELELNIEFKGYSKPELEDILKAGDYNISLCEYSSNYNDPMSVLENWLSTSKSNTFGYNNSKYDNFILKAKLEEDKQKRNEFLQKGELQLLNDMPTIPVCFQNTILCKRSNIKGIYVTTEGNVKLDRAYIDINSDIKS